MFNRRFSRHAGLTIFLLSFLFAAMATAYPGNTGSGPGYVTSQVFGASGGDGMPADDNGGCTGCHAASGATLSSVLVNGVTLSAGSIPTFNVSAGMTSNFTLTWTPPAGKPLGGFLLMHNDISANNSAGTLGSVDASVHQCQGAASGSGSTRCNGTLNNNTELMHEVPRAAAGGVVSFPFRYTANGTGGCGTLEFGVWANAVNGDNQCFNSSDAPSFFRFRISTNCDDANPCTTDSCTASGCTHVNNTNPCSDGNSCTTGDVCNGGACTGTPIVCTASDQCHSAGLCSAGVCSNPTKPNGSACNDGNSCTNSDVCQSGACSGSPVTCTALDQCHVAGTCAGGVCSNPTRPNGTTCDDANTCTTGEACQTGTCTGGTGVVCPPPDQCHQPASCVNGTCPANAPKPNGTACNDGNACTTGETCQSGACTAGAPTVCTALDQCHVAGTCSAGVCSNPLKPNGTTCNDGNGCTTGETCQNGTCAGGSGTVCPVADQCHTQGSCSNGTCGTNPNKPNGTPCNDGNSCTSGETCQNGLCQGGAGTICPPQGPCQGAPTCSGGTCSYPVLPNGTACSDGNSCTSGEICQNGTCSPATTILCNPGPCQETTGCNPQDGTCSFTIKPNGSPCDDGNSCTFDDECMKGRCTGAIGIWCPPEPSLASVKGSNADPHGPDAGASGASASANNDDGMTCQIGSSGGPGSGAVLGLVVLSMLGARRRRAARAKH